MEVEASPNQYFSRRSLAERVSMLPTQSINFNRTRSDRTNDRRTPYEAGALPSTSRSTTDPQTVDITQATIAIEIEYSEGQRLNQIRSFKEKKSIVTWEVLRRGITNDLHGGGLTSPSHHSYRILRNGHVFAFWPNSNPQLYKTLYGRLKADEVKERLNRLKVAAIYVMEHCEVVLIDAPFESYVLEKGYESKFNTLDKIAPTAPRAHFNAQQTFTPSVETYAQPEGDLPGRPVNSGVMPDITQTPVLTKRSREYWDEAEYPVAKKPQFQRSIADEDLQEILVLPDEEDYGDLSDIAGVEDALRIAQSQFNRYKSPATKSIFEKIPSPAFSMLQKMCRDKIHFLELLMKSSRENLTHSQILTEKEASLSAMEIRLSEAEEAANENQRLLDQGSSEHASQIHMMEEKLKHIQKEKDEAMQSRDLAEERVQEVTKVAEEQVKIAFEEKKAAEEGYKAERDRRISAEETLARVLKVVREMDTILGHSDLKLPKEFEQRIQD